MSKRSKMPLPQYFQQGGESDELRALACLKADRYKIALVQRHCEAAGDTMASEDHEAMRGAAMVLLETSEEMLDAIKVLGAMR